MSIAKAASDLLRHLEHIGEGKLTAEVHFVVDLRKLDGNGRQNLSNILRHVGRFGETDMVVGEAFQGRGRAQTAPP